MTLKTNELAPVNQLMRLFVMRHGQTAWSLSGQHTSWTDLALTPEGEAEAGKLAARLKGTAFSRVLSSPRLRARQTAELAGLGAALEVEPDLAEWNYGDYEGKLSTEIYKLQPDWNIYRDGCPNGESPDQIAARADLVVTSLRRLDGNVAIFSHGHFLRVLAVRWVALPVLEARHFGLDTASIGILAYEHGASGPPIIGMWNSV